MRTYGRIKNEDGSRSWVEVDTDANGFNDDVWITTLAQCLQLSPGESPFFSQYGIPAQQTIVTQVFPDFYVALTQSQFAQYFASLIISRVQQAMANPPSPTYNVNILTNQGKVVNAQVAT